MYEFVSLKPSGLVEDFDLSIHGESPVVSVRETDDLIELSYIFPGFQMSNDDRELEGEVVEFKEVGISGVGFLSVSGQPLLPSFGRFVQIPSGCDFQYKVKPGRPVRFEDFKVTPAQEKALDGPESAFEFDAESYGRDGYFPSKLVEVHGPQFLDGYRVLTVHVRPLQFNPGTEVLRGYSNITVEIRLKTVDAVDAADVEECPVADPNLGREGFGNLVLNPRRRIEERFPSIVPPAAVRPGLVDPGPELLIIYDRNLEQPADRLRQWKIRRGLRTEAEPVTSIGNTPAALKSYIRGRRSDRSSALRYVLLFGDIGPVVTEQLGNATTDYYYFTKQDAGGGSDCVLPWISGGRIPVTSESDGHQVVDQIIRFERRPPCDPEYYRRMTFAAYFQDDQPQDGRANRAYMKTMESIRRHIVGLGFDVERVYVSNNPNPLEYKDGSPVPQEVKDAIVSDHAATSALIDETSDGQLIVGHRDHGGVDGWSHPSFEISHLSSITGWDPAIFYSINCLTGRFDANPSECFAEAMLAMDGGAPSLIAATELSGTWRNDSMMKALFDSMWPGLIPTFSESTASYSIRHHRLGDILNYAKAYLLLAHGHNSGVKNHFEIYHVIGDPTLQLWTEAPLVVNLRATVVRRALQIAMSSCPDGAVLTLWHRGKLIKRIQPRATRVTVPLRNLELLNRPVSGPPTRRGNLEICFSAPGYRYTEVRVNP